MYPMSCTRIQFKQSLTPASMLLTRGGWNARYDTSRYTMCDRMLHNVHTVHIVNAMTRNPIYYFETKSLDKNVTF